MGIASVYPWLFGHFWTAGELSLSQNGECAEVCQIRGMLEEERGVGECAEVCEMRGT